MLNLTLQRCLRPVLGSMNTLPFILSIVVAIAVQSASAQQVLLYAELNAAQEVPPTNSTATGTGCFVLDQTTHVLTYQIAFSGLSTAETVAHIHGFAPPGQSAPPVIDLPLGSPKTGSAILTADQETNFLAGLTYVNVHSTQFPNGEIRGQITIAPPAEPYCFGDGALQACPCGNDASGNDAGCINSFGTGGLLAAQGFSSLACESLVLTATGVPDAFGLFLQGTDRMNGGAGATFGDGLSCVGGSTVIIATRMAVNGEVSYPTTGEAPIGFNGFITAPGTRTYQFIYRNAATFCTGATFNTSNAVEVNWVP